MLLVGILLAGCGEDPAPTGPSLAQQTPDDYLSAHDFDLFLPDTLVDTAGAHDIRILRIYSTTAEEQLLRKAESFYPPSARVMDESGEWVDRWWFTSFDGIKINDQVTRGALEYYLATIRRFQAGDFEGTIPMQASGLTFHSAIRRASTIVAGGTTYHGVYAAEIEIEWYQYCGNVCAMGFSRKRIVIFKSMGELIRVIEPESVSYWVS